MELKRREFENLRQNDMPVLRYVRDFSILSRYAIDEVNTDEKRQKRFMKGLNPYMKMQLRLARPREFQELVNVAITFEDDYRNVQEERKKKARMEPKKIPYRKPTPNLNFKPRPRNDSPNPNRGRPNPKSQVIYHNCGYKGHYAAECRQPKIICYGVENQDT